MDKNSLFKKNEIMKTDNHCSQIEKFHFSKKVKLISFITFVVFLISFLPYPILKPLNKNFIEYIYIIWWAILLGLLLGGMIDYFVPNDFIQRYLGRKNKWTILYSVILGFILSACSHGILAIAMQLYKKGASTASVISFLLASPWANLPITLLLFSFFGWKAIFFILSALLIAIITGYIYLLLQKLNLIEPPLFSQKQITDKIYWDKFHNFNFLSSIKGVFHSGLRLSNMILFWVLLGILFAVFLQSYVPTEWITKYFGPDLKGLSFTLAAATIIEVCNEGTAPIAFMIFEVVEKLGNPFVFLMAGVITDYTEIGLIWSNIGKKVAIWLPLITVPQVMFIAYLMNLFL